MTVSLTSPVTISSDVTIAGHGTLSAITTNGSQIVVISASGDAIIEGVRIFGAVASSDAICGGAIQNDGTLQIMEALIEDNNVNGKGAGLVQQRYREP